MTFKQAMPILLTILTLFAISVAARVVRAHWVRLEAASRLPAPIPMPTVRHVPADGVVPDGWFCVVGVFRYEGKMEDAIVLPGREICVDRLRPGESIDLSVMVRLPFERAKTPGETN